MPSSDAPSERHGHRERDLGGVPQHRCDVGEEEPPVAVEDAEAPRRQHQQADAREHDPEQGDGQVEALAAEARA